MSNGIPLDDNIALRVNTACFNVVSSGATPAQADLASDEHSFLLFCLFFHNFQVQCNYSIEISTIVDFRKSPLYHYWSQLPIIDFDCLS